MVDVVDGKKKLNWNESNLDLEMDFYQEELEKSSMM